jgi:hypothetical protein
MGEAADDRRGRRRGVGMMQRSHGLDTARHLAQHGKAIAHRVRRNPADGRHRPEHRAGRLPARDAPVRRDVCRTGRVRSSPILGGLHHQYVRV